MVGSPQRLPRRFYLIEPHFHHEPFRATILPLTFPCSPVYRTCFAYRRLVLPE